MSASSSRSRASHVLARIGARRGVGLGLLLALVLVGCSAPDGGSAVTSAPGSTPDLTSGSVSSPPSTPPAGEPRVEPLVRLDPGYYFVDIRTGESVRMARRITSVPGAVNFTVSPDGSSILFDAEAPSTPGGEIDLRGPHQLYLANLDGTGLRQLTDDPRGAVDGSWSPDGTRIVYVDGRATDCCPMPSVDLKVLDLGTGASTMLAPGRAHRRFSGPFFDADGDGILVTRHDQDGEDDLWTIPARGGSPELVIEDRGGGEPSPDGTSILYRRIELVWVDHCGNETGGLWISDIDGSDPRPLDPKAVDEQRNTGWGPGGAWSPDGTRIAFSQHLQPMCDRNVYGAYVMDMETGERTLIAVGSSLDWLDDRTILIFVR